MLMPGVPNCRLLGILGEKYFGGSQSAKEQLLDILEADNLTEDQYVDADGLRILAVCYLLDGRGFGLNSEEAKRLETWKENNRGLFQEAENMVKKQKRNN